LETTIEAPASRSKPEPDKNSRLWELYCAAQVVEKRLSDTLMATPAKYGNARARDALMRARAAAHKAVTALGGVLGLI